MLDMCIPTKPLQTKARSPLAYPSAKVHGARQHNILPSKRAHLLHICHGFGVVSGLPTHAKRARPNHPHHQSLRQSKNARGWLRMRVCVSFEGEGGALLYRCMWGCVARPVGRDDLGCIRTAVGLGPVCLAVCGRPSLEPAYGGGAGAALLGWRALPICEDVPYAFGVLASGPWVSVHP